MNLHSTHVEIEDFGLLRRRPHFRQTIHMKAIAYRDNGVLVRSVHDFEDGDANFPHVITHAPMLVYTAADGMRRICPTRDPQRYVEIGAPYIKPSTTWQKAALGTPSRVGNALTWTTAQAIAKVVFGGHKIDLDVEFLNGWRPPNGQIAFPVGMNGLTRNGRVFSADGVPVLTLRPFQMVDAANPMDVRPVNSDLVQVGGQWYVLATLPSLSGMSRPVLDPTLSLQPAAADGLDTYVDDFNSNTNNGTNTLIALTYQAGLHYYGLIKFTLTGIPAGATISSATLSLFLASTAYSVSNKVYRILDANSAWTEAGATWNYAVASTTRWAGDTGADGGADAGCSVSGTDYSATQMGAWSQVNTDALGTEYAISLNLTEFASMISSNNGMVLRSANAAPTYDGSSDNATAGYRPKLVVEYTIPPSAMLSGTLVKKTAKSFSGSFTDKLTGAITKKTSTSKGGAIQPAGSLTKLAKKVVGGAVAPTGVISKAVKKTLSGALASAGALSTWRPFLISAFPGSIIPGRVVSVLRTIKAKVTVRSNSTTEVKCE